MQQSTKTMNSKTLTQMALLTAIIPVSYTHLMQNVPKVMPKINRDELAPMAQKLDLESIISPRQATANILVRFARALENSMAVSYTHLDVYKRQLF